MNGKVGNFLLGKKKSLGMRNYYAEAVIKDLDTKFINPILNKKEIQTENLERLKLIKKNMKGNGIQLSEDERKEITSLISLIEKIIVLKRNNKEETNKISTFQYTTSSIKVKPIYIIYKELYGLPNDYKFDPEKLKLIDTLLLKASTATT